MFKSLYLHLQFLLGYQIKVLVSILQYLQWLLPIFSLNSPSKDSTYLYLNKLSQTFSLLELNSPSLSHSSSLSDSTKESHNTSHSPINSSNFSKSKSVVQSSFAPFTKHLQSYLNVHLMLTRAKIGININLNSVLPFLWQEILL